MINIDDRLLDLLPKIKGDSLAILPKLSYNDYVCRTR